MQQRLPRVLLVLDDLQGSENLQIKFAPVSAPTSAIDSTDTALIPPRAYTMQTAPPANVLKASEELISDKHSQPQAMYDLLETQILKIQRSPEIPVPPCGFW